MGSYEGIHSIIVDGSLHNSQNNIEIRSQRSRGIKVHNTFHCISIETAISSNTFKLTIKENIEGRQQ